MKKIFFQLLVIIASFVGVWFIMSSVNWMKVLHIEKLTRSTEEKLGDMMWDLYSTTKREMKEPAITKRVDSLLTRICKANKIDKGEIHLHILKSDEINAFALPNHHLVIYSGLILDAENEMELCGVMAHELAHIQQKHVMKKLAKEIGLSALISVTSGSGNPEVLREAIRALTSSAFDRKMERDADITGAEYLMKADIDPKPLADFLFRLSEKEPSSQKYFSWVSTHPDSKERAAYILKYTEGMSIKNEPVLSENGWEQLKAELREE